jgi:hypothetical protein
MAKSNFHPELYPISTVGFRGDSLPLPKALELLMTACSDFHTINPVEKIGPVATAITINQFWLLSSRLVELTEQAEMFAKAFPETKEPTILVGDFLSSLDKQSRDILEEHRKLNPDKPVNPFEIEDPRYYVISNVVSFVEARHNYMKDSGS